MKRIRRHPLAIAFDEWLASEEGQKAINPSILSSSEQQRFLINRISTAYFAGANAAEHQNKGPDKKRGSNRL